MRQDKLYVAYQQLGYHHSIATVPTVNATDLEIEQKFSTECKEGTYI